MPVITVGIDAFSGENVVRATHNSVYFRIEFLIKPDMY